MKKLEHLKPVKCFAIVPKYDRSVLSLTVHDRPVVYLTEKEAKTHCHNRDWETYVSAELRQPEREDKKNIGRNHRAPKQILISRIYQGPKNG